MSPSSAADSGADPSDQRAILLRLVLKGVVCLSICFGSSLYAADDDQPMSSSISELATMSLEDLSNLRVSTVSKHDERVTDAPAAVFVLTGEDIRRSGFTSIPEALRMAPGLEVARLDSHNWAITARGFNDLYADKLLVLIDGRSVYTPLFSGVYWDVQDTFMEDIDRIEVIRGPGATMWGANAVNGVINIITRSSKETQGGLLVGGFGTEEQGFAGVRYGGSINDALFYRVYAKVFNRDDSALPSGARNNDDWQSLRGGFRFDYEPSAQNLFTLQGDAYYAEENQTFFLFTPAPGEETHPSRIYTHGANILGRWTHSFTSESELKLQSYYDRTSRHLDWFDEIRDTADVELQYRLPIGDRQNLQAGIGYRYSDSHNLKSNFTLSYFPLKRETHIFNTFLQDDISIVKDRLHLTLGSKFEHNDFTGWEIQPSARLLWTPHHRHSFWAAVSRAVRTPSQADLDARIVSSILPGTPPTLVSLQGNPDFRSEILLAYELGYRVQPHRRVSADLALFYNDYDRLRSFEPGATDFSAFPAYVGVPLIFANELHGHTMGGELAVNFQAMDWWQWRASYSYIKMHLEREPGSQDTVSSTDGDFSPQHQVAFRSLMELPWNFQFDTMVRYVDTLRGGIPGYVGLDLRLGWRPRRNLDISIVAQNLLDDRHPEFGPAVIRTPAAEIERAVYGKVTFGF